VIKALVNRVVKGTHCGKVVHLKNLASAPCSVCAMTRPPRMIMMRSTIVFDISFEILYVSLYAESDAERPFVACDLFSPEYNPYY